jgi:hypothetical protein
VVVDIGPARLIHVSRKSGWPPRNSETAAAENLALPVPARAVCEPETGHTCCVRGARMNRLTLALMVTGLLLEACGNDMSMSPGADAMAPATGGAGGRGGATGGTGGAGGAGGGGGSAGGSSGGITGGSGPGGTGDARGPDVIAQDARTGDAPSNTIKPPMAPPIGTRTCAPGCQALRAEYAEAVLRAQRCSAGGQSPCALKAPGSLGCGGCQVWVSDLTEVAPIANRFNDLGCYGCWFDGAAGDNRCHTVGCADLEIPICAAQGTCINMAKDRTCPPGLMTGTPCTRQPDYCLGGGHTSCYCSANTPNWTCF